MLMLYNRRHDVKDSVATAAKDLGKNGKQKQRTRLMRLGEMYSIEVDTQARGLESADSFVKVGGLCCDCRNEETSLCTNLLQEAGHRLRLPVALWIFRGRQETSQQKITAADLVYFALANLGLAFGGRSEL